MQTTGLFFLVVGQIILSKGQEFAFRQKPIDYAHWFLLAGAILIFTFSSVLPKSAFQFVGTTITIMGITAFIGMCVQSILFFGFSSQKIVEMNF